MSREKCYFVSVFLYGHSSDPVTWVILVIFFQDHPGHGLWFPVVISSAPLASTYFLSYIMVVLELCRYICVCFKVVWGLLPLDVGRT